MRQIDAAQDTREKAKGRDRALQSAAVRTADVT